MKTNLLKILAVTMLFACCGKIKAQSDLLAVNSSPLPISVASMFKSEDKITVSEFLTKPTGESSSQVSIKCTVPQKLQVKIFNMDGNMEKQEMHDLENGVSELSVDLSTLPEGEYMVQFYSKEGSAVRRLVKSN